jgi:hypothetical protein
MFNFWKWDEKLEFTGRLVNCLPKVGVFKKPVYVFKVGKKGKKEYHIWGTAQINKALYHIRFGTLLKIKFLGKIKTDESRYPVSHFEIKTYKEKIITKFSKKSKKIKIK